MKKVDGLSPPTKGRAWAKRFSARGSGMRPDKSSPAFRELWGHITSKEFDEPLPTSVVPAGYHYRNYIDSSKMIHRVKLREGFDGITWMYWDSGIYWFERELGDKQYYTWWFKGREAAMHKFRLGRLEWLL